MKKPLYVRLDTNPGTVTLSNDIANAQEIELVYFRMINFQITSTATMPKSLSIKIEQCTNLNDSIVVPSNNRSANLLFSPPAANIAPLHFKIHPVIANSSGTLIYTPLIYGKQPKEMRWSSYNNSTFNSFRVSILTNDNNPLDITSGGTCSIELVFRAKWSPTVQQPMNWKTDKVFMNSMNA